jgi:hypothetical protein
MEHDLDGDAICTSSSGKPMRYIEILYRVPAGVCTVLAQSANDTAAGAESESIASY